MTNTFWTEEEIKELYDNAIVYSDIGLRSQAIQITKQYLELLEQMRELEERFKRYRKALEFYSDKGDGGEIARAALKEGSNV